MPIEFDFYFDDELQDFHIRKHEVTEYEINDFFKNSVYFTRKRKDGSFTSYGKLRNGRYIKVVYRKITNYYYNIITAYDVDDLSIINEIEEMEEKKKKNHIL